MREESFRFYDTTGKHISINYCEFGIRVDYKENEIDFKFTYDYYLMLMFVVHVMSFVVAIQFYFFLLLLKIE